MTRWPEAAAQSSGGRRGCECWLRRCRLCLREPAGHGEGRPPANRASSANDTCRARTRAAVVLVDDRVGRGLRDVALLSSAAERSLSDTKGTPAASWTSAFSVTDRGTSGLSAMPDRKVLVRADDQHGAHQRGSDRRAEIGGGVLQPADLPLRSSGTAPTVTAPSCEANAPAPNPANISGQVTISGPLPTSSRTTSITSPRANDRSPPGNTAWRRVGQELGDAHRGEQEHDRHRHQPNARGDRRQAEGDRQEQRHQEEQTEQQEELEEEGQRDRRAGARTRNRAGSTSGSRP